MILRSLLGGLALISLAVPSAAPAQSAFDIRPDLSATVTASPNPVPAGTQVTYTLSVRNGQGGGFFATANGVRVVHNLPSGIGFQSASGDHGFTCSFAAPAVTCSGGSLPSQVTATITVLGTAFPFGFPRVSTTIVDPLNTVDERNESNNGASVSVAVGLPDLTADIEYSTRDACVLSVLGTCYRWMQVLDRTLAVRNQGIAKASSVVVDVAIIWQNFEALAPRITRPVGWSCVTTADETYAHRWRCTTAQLAAGTTATLVVTHLLTPLVGVQTEVHIDPTVAVLESNESNNFLTK
jgi:uncharacterized repeat protein (TIGR01451 family)